MSFRIFKCHPDAQIPAYQTEGAAGFDLHSIEDIVIPPGRRYLVRTGLKVSVPVGFELQIRPRSGLALKYGVTVLNSPGTVDSDYRGEVGALLINHGLEAFAIKKGDRIAQGVLGRPGRYYVTRIDEVSSEEELGATERGTGGFGSTGV